MQAIVLAKRDFRESDQVVSFYSREQGRLDLVAKGSKKITSKNASQLEPMALVDIAVTPGKEFDYVTSVYGVAYFPRIRKRIERSLIASHMLGVILRMVKAQEPDPALYDLICSYLSTLNEEERISFAISDSFMLKACALLGFDPELSQCVVTGEEEIVAFSPALGGMVSRSAAVQQKKQGIPVFPCSAAVCRIFRLYRDASWDALIQADIDRHIAQSLHTMIQQYVQYQTEQRLPDILKTHAWIGSMLRS